MDSPHGVKRPLEEGTAPEGEQQLGPPQKRVAPGERAETVMRLIVPARKVNKCTKPFQSLDKLVPELLAVGRYNPDQWNLAACIQFRPAVLRLSLTASFNSIKFRNGVCRSEGWSMFPS